MSTFTAGPVDYDGFDLAMALLTLFDHEETHVDWYVVMEEAEQLLAELLADLTHPADAVRHKAQKELAYCLGTMALAAVAVAAHPPTHMSSWVASYQRRAVLREDG